MAGFTKLVPEIVLSSIWNESPEVRCVWIAMLATKDENGYVRGNAASLARIANVSLESAKEAIEKFQLPDPESNTPDNDGRRIQAVPGGWFVLNHALYRGKDYREYEAERKREYRRSHPLSGTRPGHVPDASASAYASDSASDGDGVQGKGKPPKQATAIPESLATVEGFAEAIAADAAQAANAEPPVTRAEADARAAQAGVPPDLVERWWLFQLEQGWVNARGHRMSRDGAFASLMRWKISEHRFAKLDELTAKRIEAAEAIASRNGRNQATAQTGDPRNAKPGGFYDSGSQEDAWPELTAAERRAEELERRAK